MLSTFTTNEDEDDPIVVEPLYVVQAIWQVIVLAVMSPTTLYGIANVVDAPTPVCVSDQLPAVTVIVCVNDDDARFVLTVSVFVCDDSVIGFGDAVHCDALGIVGNAIDPLAEILKPRPEPLHKPLMLNVFVPSALCVTVVEPVRTVSVVNEYKPSPLFVVQP